MCAWIVCLNFLPLYFHLFPSTYPPENPLNKDQETNIILITGIGNCKVSSPDMFSGSKIKTKMLPYERDLHLEQKDGNSIILEDFIQVFLDLEMWPSKAFILLRYVFIQSVSPKLVISLMS